MHLGGKQPFLLAAYILEKLNHLFVNYFNISRVYFHLFNLKASNPVSGGFLFEGRKRFAAMGFDE